MRTRLIRRHSRWLATLLILPSLFVACQGRDLSGPPSSETPASPQGTPASPQGGPASPQGTPGSPQGAAAPKVVGTPVPPPPLGDRGSPIFSASFADPANTGLTFLSQPNVAQSGVEAGAYWISIAERWQAAWAAPERRFNDFIAETEVMPHADTSERGYGLAFRIRTDRDQMSSYYLFWVNPAGPQYALHRVDRGQFAEILPWRPTAALPADTQPDKLTDRAQRPRIDLYLNDQPIASVTDETYREGQVALYLSAWSVPGVRANFLSFRVYDVQ